MPISASVLVRNNGTRVIRSKLETQPPQAQVKVDVRAGCDKTLFAANVGEWRHRTWMPTGPVDAADAEVIVTNTGDVDFTLCKLGDLGFVISGTEEILASGKSWTFILTPYDGQNGDMKVAGRTY